VDLFTCSLAKLVSNTVFPGVETPIGNIRFDAWLGNKHITEEPAQSTYCLPNDSWVLHWRSTAYTAELLLSPILYWQRFSRQRDRTDTVPWWILDDVRAGLWRVQASMPMRSSEFVSRWEAGYRWQTGGINSGQGLAAQQWDDIRTLVALGTQDDQWLALAATEKSLLPTRWLTTPNSLGTVEYLDDGLRVQLPNLQAGEHCQLQFAVAWGPYGMDNDGPWFAVDSTPEMILMSAECV
jgi:hypothetical protein